MQTVKIDKALRVLIGLLLVAFVYVIYASIQERVVAVGDSAPKFSITADGGRTVSVPDFGGKLLVLNFWATWCPPCVEETPSLSEFASRFAGKGVVVLGVSVDKDEKAYRGFLKQYRPAFLTARDPSADISSLYGTFKYPETYIINKDGKVVAKLISNQDWTRPEIIRQIEAAL